jgi:hypothetical protein
MGFKTFTAGSTLPASDINTYLMQQAVIVATSATRPGSPVQGMVVFETDTNLLQIYNGSAWIPYGGIGAWQTYAPTWTTSGTAPAIGNGSISGRYVQFGKTVHFKILFTAGTTTTFGTGTWSFSLPVVNSANTLEQDIVGRVNPGGQAYPAIGTIFANNTVVGVQSVTSQTDTRVTGVDSTHPATWTATSSNVIVLSGTYEVA